MKIKIFQKGFNYSQDGEGNRLVYHLQHCNMHCPWCANPEGISKAGTLVINSEFLIDNICPHGAIRNKLLNRSLCETCSIKECITSHRTKGIKLSCSEYEIDSIIDEVKRSSALFYDGGGVTLTGGEPTLQFEAINMLLKSLKTIGIHTVIETNATHPRLYELFPFIDMLIMDFKHYDNDIHAHVTGVGNTIIKENIGKAMSCHPRLLIHIPVIKGFNDSEKDAMGFAAFFKQYITTNVSFELLPYHEYGKSKYLQCGMNYTMKNAFVDAKSINLFENIFKENNLLIVHT
jgi:pyruvate formate lyase activating enzyme